MSPAVALEAPQPAPVVIETLQERISRIAEFHNIETKKLSNLVTSESHGDGTKVSPQGDRGVTQISAIYHPEVTDDCAFDLECALNWTAKRLNDGYDYEWTVCNCYSFIKTKYPDLPKMADIQSNSVPKAGGVAITYYNGRKHLSYIKSVSGGVLSLVEANFEPCMVGSREISVDDKHLMGVWFPQSEG